MGCRPLLLNDDKPEDGIEIVFIPVCPNCFKGTLRGDVIPTGHEDVIHGLPTYIATPKPWVRPLGTVVLITDAFGWSLRNTRALANSFVWPRVRSFLAAVRKTPTVNGEPPKVGVARFCWAGLYAVGLTITQNPENWLPRHIHEVQLPLCLANGETVSFMGQEKRKEVMGILKDKNKASVREAEGADRPIVPNALEVVVYPGAKHGFAVGGDREDPLQKEGGDQAEDQAVRIFKMNLWSARRLFGEWCLFLPLYD
ncbi:hypothetical protein QR685DRAFT_567895 [Neurospora intermedia]|uniref:Dienelactone hydrolase domain-containing protein n=1 Tax=Neurospora intermedia TaxID=5142 RepID=A0ABR3DQU2_NEUIN